MERNNTIWFDGLCNRTLDGPFWSTDLTLNTLEPSFTTCFQYTFFYWLPLSWLLLSMPVEIYYMRATRTIFPLRSISRLCLLKSILIIVFAFITFLNILKYIEESITGTYQHGIAFVLSPSLLIVGLIYVLVMTNMDFRKGFNTSGILTIFWLLAFLSFTGQMISAISHIEMFNREIDVSSVTVVTPEYFQIDAYRIGIVMCSFVLVTAIALSHFYSDNKGAFIIYGVKTRREINSSLDEIQHTNHASRSDASEVENKRKRLSPEIFSSFIMRISYLWFTKTTWTGFKRALTIDDCWDVLPQYRSDKLVPVVTRIWDEQVQKAVDKQKEYMPSSALMSVEWASSQARILVPDDAKRMSYHVERGSSPTANLLALRAMHSSTDITKKILPSIVAPLTGVMGRLLLTSGLFKLLYDLLTFVQPVLLNSLITVIVDDNAIYNWHGYLIGVLLFLSGVIRSLFLQAFYHTGLMCGLNVRTALSGLIFRKALRLSAAGKKESTVGEIVNLMSVDIQRIQDALPFLNLLWSSPLIIGISIAMLYSQIGDAAFAGLGVILLMVPLNVIITARVKKLQAEQMIYKDERIKLTTEILNGMKVLKLYGWEMAYRKVIDDIRQLEVKVLQKMTIMQAITSTSVFAAPFLVGATCFAVFTSASTSNILTPQVAFVSLALVNTMSGPLTFFPQVLALSIQAVISMRRIRDYLLSDELVENAVTQDSDAEYPVMVQRATFSWGRNETPFLNNINLSIRDKQLVAVVGSVGSGKSSLLHAILGEMHKVSGSVNVKGRIAYVPQQAWLINATVRDNILFGQEYDKTRYDRVIRACALEPDLKILSHGDQTEIGERGINMSGGQKQRISLARAVYQNLDVYVLDDVLSAVDAHVAKHLFDNVLGPRGILANKTRILVTHAVNVMPMAEYIMVMKDGDIVEEGTFNELIAKNGGFAELIKEFLLDEEEEDEADPETESFKRNLLRQMSVTDQDQRTNFERRSSARRSRKASRSRSEAKSNVTALPDEVEVTGDKLITEESAATGNVKWDVYVAYFKALGTGLAIGLLIAYILYILLGVLSSYWLSKWSGDSSAYLNGTGNDPEQTQKRINGYFGLGAIQIAMLLTHAILFALASTRASRVLHDDVFSRIVRSPMMFFDTTPLGRITNRLSKDLDTVDILIPLSARTWLVTLTSCLVTVILVTISNAVLLAFVIPLIALFVILQRFYIRTSRQLKRIDSVLRSPIFAHFQTSLIGITSIRAYRIADKFIDTSDQLVDNSSSAYYPQCIAFRWLGVSVDALNNVMLLIVAIFSVAVNNDPSLASLAVTYTMTLTIALNLMIRSITDLETYIVSIERLKEYTELQLEAPLEDRRDTPMEESWPHEGKVEFANYSVRYRAGLDLVLSRINCVIQPGEKIGIVGRTGAGKSSLSLALFRILEPAEGTIIIDGVDITKVGLQRLRGRVTIIPQEPVLFSGSLRRNIDPFGHYGDDVIWQALECANLKAFVQSQPAGLDFVCSEGGENLSVGQRQLLCMARAVLRRSKILLLDEATAAVDVETDQLIQKTIRDEFRECTILTIAHRLNTVIDYDKIMVLDKGQVKEYDSPTNLLNDRSSQFFSMAKDAGLVHD